MEGPPKFEPQDDQRLVNAQAERLLEFKRKANFEYERLATVQYEKISTPEQNARIEKEFPVIELPSSVDSIKKLQSKFKEYKERIRKDIEENPNAPREILTDAHYKAFILEKLLTEGEVNSNFLIELGKKFGGFLQKENIKEPWIVIRDYAKTGGRGVTGGTGLK